MREGWCLTFWALMEPEIPVRVADMRMTSRDFQRDFARMTARARAGEVISVSSGTDEFVFQAVKPRT